MDLSCSGQRVPPTIRNRTGHGVVGCPRGATAAALRADRSDALAMVGFLLRFEADDNSQPAHGRGEPISV